MAKQVDISESDDWTSLYQGRPRPIGATTLFPEKPRQLYPFQSDIIDRIRKSKSRKILVVSPCGTGKTVIGVAIARRNPRVLFVAHRQELIDQAYQRLIEAGADPIEIGVVMSADKREDQGARIQIASVQTLTKRGLEKCFPGHDFDLIIVDEAHHAAATSYQAIFDRYPKALRLGLTATPCRLDGKPLGDLFDEIIESPPPEELIAAGYLSRARIFAGKAPDVKGLKKRGGDFDMPALAKRMRKRELTGDIVRDYSKRASDLPALCFATSIEHSKDIVRRFVEASIAAEHVDSATSKTERRAVLDRFAKGTTKIVSSCNILGEGFDAPWARCVIFARPTLSRALYLQQAGRGLRPGKVRPVFLDHAGHVFRFPTPEEAFGWSLTEAKKVPTGKETVAKQKECPECSELAPYRRAKCFGCGYEFSEVEMREPPLEDGEELREWRRLGESNGIGIYLFNSRVRNGWDPKKAATIPIQDRATPEFTACWVKWKSIAISNQISMETFRQRIRSNWDPKKAASLSRLGILWPRWKSIAESHGVTQSNFYSRLRKGWDPKKAATAPRQRGVTWMTWKAMVEANGIDRDTFNSRLRKGWDPKKAATTLPDRGEWSKWKSIAEANGITRNSFHARVRKGWDPKKAATNLPRKDLWPKWKKLAEEHRISQYTFSARVRKGWDPKKAATAPLLRGRPR